MLRKIVSLALGIPALVIFAGEVELGEFWMQVIAASVLVGLFMWNGMFGRLCHEK